MEHPEGQGLVMAVGGDLPLPAPSLHSAHYYTVFFKRGLGLVGCVHPPEITTMAEFISMLHFCCGGKVGEYHEHHGPTR